MSTETMERFRQVRADLQARRDQWYDNRIERRSTWHGLDIEGLAEQVAHALYDRLVYRGNEWRNLATGQAVASSVVITAVYNLLPEEVEGERREHLASVLAQSATFRAMLSARA